MKETAHAFGPGGSLIGILCEPDSAAQRREGAPAVLLSNVGMNQRIGPFRLNVDLARLAADAGFTSLRFDFSGLGDSTVRTTSAGDTERWREDIREAMTLVEKKTGIRQFAPVALCSGVDPTHDIALADDRIAGAVFIDGYAFPTRRHWLHQRVLKAPRPRAWELYVKRRAPQLFGLNAEAVRWMFERSTGVFVRTPMPREQFMRDLETLLAKGKRLFFVYTGAYEHSFSHEQQFHDMVHPVPTLGRVRVARAVSADHTFALIDDRRKLIDLCCSWLEDEFPQPGERPGEARARRSSRPPRA